MVTHNQKLNPTPPHLHTYSDIPKANMITCLRSPRQKKLIQTVLNFPVKKGPEKQPQQPNHASNDDEIVPIPESMFDTDPTTETETTAVSAPSTSLIKKLKTKSIPPSIINNTPFANDKDSTDDNNEIVKIPSGMFNTDPILDTAVVPSATNITRDSSIKVKSTTKLTPPIVLNIYECLNNEIDDDDDNIECVDSTTAINQVPRIEIAVRMNNKKMTSQVRDECDDRDDDNTNKRLVVVETRELRNTGIKKKQTPAAVFDLGTMITINRGMPGVDSEDDASVMTVATENSCEEKYNKQIYIPEGFFDTDTTNEVEHPNKRKKYQKRKPHQHLKKRYGKQTTNSTEGTGGLKRNQAGEQKEAQSNLSGNGGNSSDGNNDQQNEDTNKPSQFNEERCPGKLGGDGDTVDVEQLQAFSANLKFGDVPRDQVAKVLEVFSFECMDKIPGLTFHPTNDHTLPTPSQISTKEKFPTSHDATRSNGLL